MKGRVYDPLAGRFLTPDPVMQAPYFSQGLNRYSYAFNDPVNNVDPSGFDVDFTDQRTLSTAGIAGWAGGVTGAALGGLGGIGLGGLNAGISLFEGLPGGGSAAKTVTVTPSAAPTSAGTSVESPQAIAQNRGVGPAIPQGYRNPAKELPGTLPRPGRTQPVVGRLSSEAKRLLHKYIPTLDLGKVIVVTEANVRAGTISETRRTPSNGYAIIKFSPGAYVFGKDFDPNLLAKLYPDSPVAAGVGLVAHELVHAQQVLTIPNFDTQYAAEYYRVGGGPENKFEVLPDLVEWNVRSDIATQRGEFVSPPPFP